MRSGWKVFLLYVIFYGTTSFVGIGIWFFTLATNLQIFDHLMELGQELCEIGAVLIMVYIIERSSLRYFGFPINFKCGREISLGVVWGALSMIFIYIIFRITGVATLNHPLSDPHWSWSLIWYLFIMILVGFGEEMLTRGYTLTMLQRQVGKKWVSIGVSSLIFAALHLMNPHVSVLAFVNLVLYGVVAAFMYIRSRSLWMPIAYHATWDFFEGNIFGFPNSGMVMPSLYSFSHVTPNVFTGGGFGPEGGLIVTFILLTTLLWTLKGYKPLQEEALPEQMAREID